jgi:hypothetical protein
VVVPVKETLAESTAVLDRAESSVELRSVLERFECATSIPSRGRRTGCW